MIRKNDSKKCDCRDCKHAGPVANYRFRVLFMVVSDR